MSTIANIEDYSPVLSLIDLGWYLFPLHGVVAGKCTCGVERCGSAGKHPRTKDGHRSATNDRGRILDWIGTYAGRMNWGVSLEPSNLVVIDVDPRNGGDDGLVAFEREHGKLPDTKTNLTGGGGWHFFYANPGGAENLKNYAPKPGVEVKFRGHMVVPPSQHTLGYYRWDVGQPDRPSAAPQYLMHRMLSRGHKTYLDSGMQPIEGLIGAAFLAAGRYLGDCGPGKGRVLCPWSDEHSAQADPDRDSSTVVFAPHAGRKTGYFHCSHAHCLRRLAGLTPAARLTAILEALPPEAVSTACEQVPGAMRQSRMAATEEWERSLQWDARGEKLMSVAGNLSLLLTNSPEWQKTLTYDYSTDKMYWARQPPVIAGLAAPETGAELRDADWIQVAHWALQTKGAKFERGATWDCMVQLAKTNETNSLQAHLNALEWDGTRRLHSWLVECMGAPDTEYTHFVSRAWLIAAVERAFRPGCQADYTLILEGDQGIRKSTLFRILADRWYVGHLPRLDKPDARLALAGAWIVELQELDALSRVEFTAVKAFLTEPSDRYRPPYGHAVVTRKRQCVFGGTTNEREYLDDPTGARRFWPVKTERLDVDWITKHRSHLLAEAVLEWRGGAKAWLESGANQRLERAIEDEQRERGARDPWEDKVRNYLAHPINQGKGVQLSAVLDFLQVPPAQQGKRMAIRIGHLLRGAGWERERTRLPDKSLGYVWLPRDRERE